MPPLILRILNAAQKIKHLLKFGDLHKLNGPKLFMFRASGTSNISENFANSEKIVNMFDAGILNPAKAERLAFETAISVLNLFLSTDCVIIDENEPMLIM